MGVACRNGVVLAADTRATAGYLIASKRAQKLYEITERIAATVAGGVGDTQALVKFLRAESGLFQAREGRLISVSSVARLAANILHSQALIPFIANLLVGGVDGRGPQVYFVDLDGTVTEEWMTATGSGSPVAYGVLESEFKEGMGVEDALPIVVRAIKAAMRRDTATGNELEVMTISETGCRRLSPREVVKLV